MTPLWWYTNGVKQAGPVAESVLIDLIKKGQVHPSFFVWCNSLSDWLPITEVEVFAPVFPKTELIAVPRPKPSNQLFIANNSAPAPTAELSARGQGQVVASVASLRSAYAPRVSQQSMLLGYTFRIALIAVVISSMLPWFQMTSSTTMDLGELSSQVSLTTPPIRLPNGSELPTEFRGDFSMHATPQLSSSGSYSIATQGYMVIWIDLAVVIALVGLALGFMGPAKIFGQNCTTVMTSIAIAVLVGCLIGIINFSSFGISGSFGNGLASSTIGTHLAIGGYIGMIAALLATVTAYLTPWTSLAEQ